MGLVRHSMPWITQIVLVPITIYLMFFVFIHDFDKAYRLISALIAFSAVLASLSYSAAGGAEDSGAKDGYRESGRRFFEATVLGGIALVINFLYTSEITGAPDELPKLAELLVATLRGLAYGVGGAQLHIGLWFLQREFAKSP